MNKQRLEQRALKKSIILNLSMGIFGIAFAVIINSNAIILDGIYSFILSIMAFLTYKVSEVVSLPDDETHPLGYQNYEPLLNTVKGLIVFIVCVTAFATSVKALFSGGRLPNFGYAVIYSLLAVIGCFLMAFYQKRIAKKIKSPLLTVEGRNWFVDGAISSIVGLTFLIGFLMLNTPFVKYVPYLDPLLTTVLAAGIVVVPLKTIKEGVSELLYMAPNERIQATIKKRYHCAAEEYPFLKSRLRIIKVGRLLYTSATVLLDKDLGWTLEHMDEVREKISKKVSKGEANTFVEVYFTSKEEWL